MITIDGSHGEGGGQVLRTAVALAARTRTPLTVENIRAGRPNPGLRPQHLAAVHAVAQACNGHMEGDEVGSTRLVFEPGKLTGGHVRVDTGTAASVVLVLQALTALAPALPAPLRLHATGGTDVKWAPTLEHARSVLAPLARRAGTQLELLDVQRGFYPKGGGSLEARVHPATEMPWADVLADRGEPEGIEVRVCVAQLPDDIAERVGKSCARVLQRDGYKVTRSTQRVEAASPGVVVDAVARFEHTVLGANRLGERGVPSEQVGDACGQELLAELVSPATVDVHTADQLVPLLHGRAGGVKDAGARRKLDDACGFVVREVSGHLRTNLATTARLLDGGAVVEETGPRAYVVRLW